MLRLAKERNEISVVSDQIGSPTYSADLSKLICEIIITDKFGVYHASNEGFCSWYEFACDILNTANIKTKIISITTRDYPIKAMRPLNAKLSKDKLVEAGFSRLTDYSDG